MLTNRRGFSLVELMVVVAIFGVVATVILDLYINVQRSTVSSEEVVEVQQGMRIALEQVSRDIQLSGFLVPTEFPITVANSNSISMETASAFNSFARISTAASFAAGSPPAQAIAVSNGAMAQLFSDGAFVRIIQPATGTQLGGVFVVKNVNASSLNIETVANLPAIVNLVPGDMIVQVPSPNATTGDPTFPNVVTYQLEDDPASADPLMFVLSRIWRTGLPALTVDNRNTNERIIATNITGLRFEYLMKDGTVASTVAGDPRANIVAVRIFLTGLTEKDKTGASKTRELQTTVKLRNI